MRAFSGVAFALALALSIPSSNSLSADSHGSVQRGHRRAGVSSLEARDQHLGKRYDNTRFTFFDTGLGACGKTNQPGDFIVALNSAQYAGGSHCFETITIQYGGKSTQAQITDECPGCPFGGLDMTTGLFDFFASEDKGVLYGSWSFGEGDAPKPKPKPPPKTSSSSKAKPSTSTSTSTSTSASPPPSSTAKSSTVTTTSTTSSSPPPMVTDPSVQNIGPITLSDTNNLYTFNLALIQLGVMVEGAAHSQ